MASKKTKKGKSNTGLIGGMVDSLTNAFGPLTNAPAPLTQDFGGGKESSGDFQDYTDRPPDRVRRGVASIKAQPTTYSEFVNKGFHIHTSDPFHASYGSGYEAEWAKRTNNTPLNGKHNGLISFDGANFGIPLFVKDLNIDFTLSGSSVQSQKGAVFYPRNFNQTTLKLTCQAPNPMYYGKVMEAIRDSQMPFARVSKLQIWQPNYNATIIRGRYKDIDCDGYVSQATRRHERHVFSPDFTLEFTVVQFRKPTEWADDTGSYTMQQDWHKMITPSTSQHLEFEEAPDVGKTAADRATSAIDRAANAQKQADKANKKKSK